VFDDFLSIDNIEALLRSRKLLSVEIVDFMGLMGLMGVMGIVNVCCHIAFFVDTILFIFILSLLK
jgi:hypothetical protein